MKTIIVLAFDLPEADDVAAILTAIDPPRLAYFDGTARIAVERDAELMLTWLDEGDDAPQIKDPAEMMRRNAENLQQGLMKARTAVNAMKRRDDRAAHDAMNHLVMEFIRTLTRDAREQLVVNALTIAVQIQDQLNTAQAFAGTRKAKS